MDGDGCPDEEQPFPPPTKILQRFVPLWDHSVYTWAQILGRGPDGCLFFLDARELQWANPVMRTPFSASIASGPRILASALVLHGPSSLGKTQAEHYDHPALGPPHCPKTEADPSRGLDSHPKHPLPADT